MKRDIIFALIFLAIGFAIGFWTGTKNALAPLVTVENVQDEEQSSSQSEEMSNKIDTNALTVVSFVQDWLDYEATISLKNNTDKTISYFTATIIYKDMKGNILDYQEINQNISIAPKMAKSFKIEAFGQDNDYAYYSSEKYKPNKNRVFKIEFKLNSYK
ncbi:MAG: hypothetical protein IJ759_00940 [Bacteroidales bacterium]|nr:hypothetical protein [Bacteroidales bacterium]